jgi:hypothetical protein
MINKELGRVKPHGIKILRNSPGVVTSAGF